jgi:hypothetical protein
MLRHLFTSLALVGFVLAVQPHPAAAQNSSSSTTAQHKPMAKRGHMMKPGMAKPGHQMDNVADKLNACQAKPQGERQSCMNAVTH